MSVLIICLVAVAAGGCAYYYVKNKTSCRPEARSRMDSVDDMSSDDAVKRMRDGDFLVGLAQPRRLLVRISTI